MSTVDFTDHGESSSATIIIDQPVTNNDAEKHTWTESETATLIEIWGSENMQSKFKDKIHTNKKVFEMIATLLVERLKKENTTTSRLPITGKQCSDKMRTLKGRYEKLARELAKSGTANKIDEIKRSFIYFESLDRIMGSSPLVQPVVLVESSLGRAAEEDPVIDVCSTSPNSTPKTPESAKSKRTLSE